MKLSDPTGAHNVQQWLEALVDDTSIFTNIASNPNVHDLVRSLESDAQYWAHLLSVSGGCLELPKCFYYVLAWNFTPQGDPKPLTSQEISGITSSIELSEFGKDINTSIKMQSVDEAHKTLGVYKTMIGMDKSHLKYLWSRSNNMASIVATSGMFPYQTDVALRMIYTSAMPYSLPAVNISEKDLDKLQNKAMEYFVPAMGYNGKTPKAILMGPSDYGGAAIPHLYTESHIHKIEMIIMHVRASTELGTLFLINLNWIQLISGYGIPFFEHAAPQSYLHNRFTGIRDFLISINGTLRIDNTYVPILERKHDRFLMPAFESMVPKLSKNQIRYVLYWRLFFKVQVLSDICNAKGDSILDVYMTYPTLPCTQLRPDKTSKVDWPFQPSPTSKSTFALWVRCLRHCFLSQLGNKLRSQLGDWVVSPSTSLSQWTAYYDPIATVLYIRQSDTITVYTDVVRYTGSTSIFDSMSPTTIDTIPSNCIPIDIRHTATNIIAIHSKIQNATIFHVPIPILTIDDAINQAPPWQFHLLRNYRIHNIDNLIRCFEAQSDTILSVTDGGCRDGIGSYGVAVGTMNEELYCIEGPAPGHEELMSSFRSEGYGMLAGLNFMALLITTHKIVIPPNRVFNIYCDNLALVNWVNKLMICTHTPRMYIRSESDIVMQILHELKQLAQAGVCIQIHHVKGHQDDKIPYADLSRPAQLNVAADTYATNFLDQGTPIKYISFPANPISFYISDKVITRSHKSEIRKSSRSPALRVYLIKRFQWADNTPDLVWWQIHGSSILSLPFNDRRRIRKYIFRWLPTCVKLKQQDDNIDPTCPSCGKCEETHFHLLKCDCSSRAILKNTWFAKLMLFLYNPAYTPALMGQILYNMIVSTCTFEPPIPLPNLPSYLQKACDEQALIGWDQLICGRLSFQWGTIIANYLYHRKCPEKEMSALTWGRKFVRLMFDLVLQIWDQRNGEGHFSTKKHDSKLIRDRLIANITTMQASHPDIQHSDRIFVFRSMDTLESYSLSNLQAWYRMAKNIIAANCVRNVRTIRSGGNRRNKVGSGASLSPSVLVHR